MNKPFPIRVEAVTPLQYRFVEIMITDSCNYNCIFCGDENKLGRRGRFEYNEAIKMLDKIAEICDGKPYWISFTGGEPTLHPEFIEIAQYAKQKGAMVRLISNGSRTLRWWEKLRDTKTIDLLFITYHSQQNADYKHIANVVNLFQDEPTALLILATYTQNYVKQVLEGCDYLIDNTGAALCINAMDLNQQYMYEIVEPEDFEKIKKYTWIRCNNHETKRKPDLPYELLGIPKLKTTYDDGSTTVLDGTYMMKTGLNQFLDWNCDIGMETMKIEPDIIYRGGCRVESKPYSLENITFWKDPIVCTKKDCYCATDMMVLKSKDK